MVEVAWTAIGLLAATLVMSFWQLRSVAGGLGQRIDGLSAEHTAINARIDRLSAEHTAINSRIDRLSAEHTAINSRIDGVNSRLDSDLEWHTG